MRILFLSQRVPFPPNRGDKITTSKLIERMRRKHSVRCVAFAHGEADAQGLRELAQLGVGVRSVPYRDTLAKLGALPLLFTRKPLTLGVYGSTALQAIVDEEIAQADLAYAYSSSMGAFLERHSTTPRVMHFGELDSDKWRQYAERGLPPMSWVHAREQRTLLAFERRIARSFSENVVCTPLEQRVFQEQIPGASCVVLRNGVDLERFHPRENAPQPGELVFTGVMNYHPNAEGCAWFVHEILPLIRAKRPEARFTIVGSSPTRAVERLAEVAGVRVTGFVPDTRSELRRASVAVAPLRIARGIQNKVLEALAMGLPVVGTTPATQGVEGELGRDFLVADDAQSFAARVVELLERPDEARALGQRGRAFVERQYDWENVLAPLEPLLERCRGARAKSG